MSQSTFNLLQDLNGSLQGASCLPQEPFMKLGQGQAPILNYSLEQKSSFTTYGYFKVDIPDNYFNSSASDVPTNNFFDRVSELSVADIQGELEQDLRRGGGNILSGVHTTASLPTVTDNAETETMSRDVASENTTAVPIGTTGATTSEVAQAAANGRMPILYKRMGGFSTRIKELLRPQRPKGNLKVVQ